MSTVTGIGGELDDALMAHDALLLSVVSADSEGGSTITPLEGHVVRRHFYDVVAPAALDASDGLSVIRSITSSQGGVRGERTRQRIVHIWERRGIGRSKVLPFARRTT